MRPLPGGQAFRDNAAKRATFSWSSLAVGLVTAVLLWYFAGAAWRLIRPYSIQTQPVRQGMLSEELQGLALYYRPSDWVSAPIAGRVTTLVSEGARVSAGTLIAEIDPVSGADANEPLTGAVVGRRKLAGRRVAELEEQMRLLKGEIASQEIRVHDAIAADDLSDAAKLRKAVATDQQKLAPLQSELKKEQALLRQAADGYSSPAPMLIRATQPGEVTFRVDEAAWSTPAVALEQIGVGLRSYRLGVDEIQDGSLVKAGEPLYGLTESGDARIYMVVQGLHSFANRSVVGVSLQNATLRGNILAFKAAEDRTALVLSVSGDAKIPLGTRAPAALQIGDTPGMIVDASALQQRGGVTGVYVLVGNRPVFRSVHVRARLGSRAAIDGVPEGARVVVHPRGLH